LESETQATSSGVEGASPKGGRIYNRILANVVKGLKVNDDARQQELALKVFASCPELVAGYWPAAALTLEPRLSSKWIANIAFFGSVITLPLPVWSFLVPNSTLYQPTPPPLSAFLENVLPSVNIKVHLSRGLQSASPLVQHCTALALTKCLEKYARVLDVMRKVEAALEEDAENGQWSRRRRDLEREVRKRVPEFQVIIAALQQPKPSDPAKDPPNDTQIALLAESSTRLLWLYHKCLPALVDEARFDVGKLVQNLVDEGDHRIQSTAGFHKLRQLHILRLLRDNDQFVWSGKAGTLLYFFNTAASLISVKEIRPIYIFYSQNTPRRVSPQFEAPLSLFSAGSYLRASFSSTTPTKSTHGFAPFLRPCVHLIPSLLMVRCSRTSKHRLSPSWTTVSSAA
jgi:nucleolar pre-ribosomal-associated protein 1